MKTAAYMSNTLFLVLSFTPIISNLDQELLRQKSGCIKFMGSVRKSNSNLQGLAAAVCKGCQQVSMYRVVYKLPDPLKIPPLTEPCILTSVRSLVLCQSA